MIECVACSEAIKPNAKLCKHCGTLQSDSRFASPVQKSLSSSGSPSAHNASRYRRLSKSNVITLSLVMGLSILAASLVATFGSAERTEEIVGGPSSDTSQSPPDELNVPDTSWIPKGYELIGENVAGKIANHTIDCIDCGGLSWKVVSKLGCMNGLYVEANFIDESGTVIDWSNDSIPTLGAMEKGIIELITYSDAPNLSVELSQVNCNN